MVRGAVIGRRFCVRRRLTSLRWRRVNRIAPIIATSSNASTLGSMQPSVRESNADLGKDGVSFQSPSERDTAAQSYEMHAPAESGSVDTPCMSPKNQ